MDEGKIIYYHWNNTDRGKPEYAEKHLSQSHFVHHKSHMDWPWN
jgi:hypothetical protein